MKRALSLFLALAMILCMLSACGSSSSSTSTTSTQTEETSTTAESTAETTTEEAAVATEEAAAPAAETSAAEEQAVAEEAPAAAEEISSDSLSRVVVQLPLTDETVTFSIWYTFPPILSNFIETPGDSPFFVELEERTGVHLDFHTVSTETAETEFSLMLVSGDYTDLTLSAATSYYTNMEQAIEDDFLINIADYVDEYMPNFKAVYTSSEAFERATVTENGYIVECLKYQTLEGNNVGPVVRGDWLEELGLDVPTTYEDFYDMLMAFKVEIGASAPMLAPYTGIEDYYSMGYGVPAAIEGAFYVVDGEVKFTGLEQDYYDFVTLMAQWYADGLIDQDFLSRTTTTDPDTGLIYGDSAGLWSANVLMFDTTVASATNENFAITPVPVPTKSDGSGIITSGESQVTSGGYNITTACSNVELAVQWIDYWYSEEGCFLANYGMEGISFAYDDAGEPYLLPDILQSPMGLPSSLTLSIYVVGNGPFLEDVGRCYYYFSDSQTAALELWDKTQYESVATTYPDSADMTVDEASTYNAIMGDIETYMEETILRVIVGQSGTEALDELEANLKAMGIETALSIKQAAYDRYAN